MQRSFLVRRHLAGQSGNDGGAVSVPEELSRGNPGAVLQVARLARRISLDGLVNGVATKEEIVSVAEATG